MQLFVAACISGGYHVELAGGGHFKEDMLRSKIDEILMLIEPGEALTLNILYLNASMWNMQYPLMLQMREEGYPIDGITVAAGVPSSEVAKENN